MTRIPIVAATLFQLALAFIDQQEFTEGETLLRECLQIRRKQWPKGHRTVFSTQSLLGACLTGLERFTEGESLLLDGYQGLHDNPDAIPQLFREVRLRESLERMVNLYEAWHAAEPDAGYDVKAAEGRARLEAGTSRPTTLPAK